MGRALYRSRRHKGCHAEARTRVETRLRVVRHAVLRPDENAGDLPEMRHRTAGRAAAAEAWRQRRRPARAQESRRGRRGGRRYVASIFVNPLQFDESGDFEDEDEGDLDDELDEDDDDEDDLDDDADAIGEELEVEPETDDADR